MVLRRHRRNKQASSPRSPQPFGGITSIVILTFSSKAAMHIHDEHISAFIDGQLPHQEHLAVEERLRHDETLATEYRSIQTIKSLLNSRTNTLRLTTPADARHTVLVSIEQEWHRTKVLERIEQESKRQASGKIEEAALQQPLQQQPALSLVSGKASTHTLSTQHSQQKNTQQSLRSTPKIIGFLQKRPYILAAALVVVIGGWIGLRFLFSPPSNLEPIATQEAIDTRLAKTKYEGVFIKESLRNYHAVCEGKITLQYKTNSFEELDKFFHANGIHYNIVHPKIKADLLGGVVSEENGKKSAHLVFKHGDTLLYMWEIDLDDNVIRHTSFQDNVWNLLRKGEWLWDTATEDSTTVVFWEDDKHGHRTLCSVVATLPQKELQPLFQ